MMGSNPKQILQIQKYYKNDFFYWPVYTLLLANKMQFLMRIFPKYETSVQKFLIRQKNVSKKFC